MTPVAARSPLVEAGSSALNPHLVRIRDLVYQVAGIFHPDHKLRFLEERCGRRMKELKIENLRDYLECLTSRPNHQAEMVALLNETTVGETYFFRNGPQLDALRTVILPRIVQEKAKLPVRRLKIWSAGPDGVNGRMLTNSSLAFCSPGSCIST